VSAVTGYTIRDVAQLLDLTESQVRGWVRSGFLDPRRGPRREYRFSFQDLVLLRTARSLIQQSVPPARVKVVLQRLRAQLPRGRPLTGVQIQVDGDQIVVNDGEQRWEPESGQARFDFEVAELARRVEPLARAQAEAATADDEAMTAEDWFDLALDLETVAPLQAKDAYRRALELEPLRTDARMNLGRLLIEEGRMSSADAHFRLAEMIAPEDPVPAFNRAVTLEALGQLEAASDSLRRAITAEPTFREAYLALARIQERLGDRRAALRTLTQLKRIGADEPPA
jgi:tetratricopeptide (TPR) repeat protein